MSTEQSNTPEVDQPSTPQDKKERNHNGLYRRNSRLNKMSKDAAESLIQNEKSNSVEEKTIPEPELKVKKIRSKTPTVKVKKTQSVVKNSENETITTSTDNPIIDNSEIKEPVNTPEEITELKDNKKTKNSSEQAKAEVVEEPVVTIRSVFHELLYLIRQKNAYNHNEFFLELDRVLETVPFENIKESNLSLFGFACMYDREVIFQNLCEHYSQFIKQEDLESIMKICFTKREETVGNLIKVYTEHFKPSPEFIQSLFTYMSISSYRENNNIQILEWVAPYLTDQEYDTLWSKCLENRNISLMNTAFHVPSIKEHLQKNYDRYIDKFKAVGREHVITEALKREYRKIKVTPINSNLTPIIKKTYLADTQEQLKTLQQDEQKSPVVVFKNPRKNTDN